MDRLQRELNNLPEALALSLVHRGVSTFEEARLFFRPALEHLHDPLLMQDMERAARRVATAVRGRERVLVYGDYDVDGTTSTALMVSFLRDLGASVEYFVPHRIEDGYGLGSAGIRKAAALGASLIIALDCGITAREPALEAKGLGLDLIIGDHHTPEGTLPDATAVLNPKRADCSYPFKELSGCGVGFKLAQAVCTLLGEPQETALNYLDLVALSIASDIVPMVGENRVLMAEGLKLLREGGRPGIFRLAEQAGLDLKTCSTQNLVFGLGPRINAAGRMGSAEAAVDLLLAPDMDAAHGLAQELEAANQNRRLLDKATLAEADAQAGTRSTEHSAVLYSPDWHPGVVGIVASRIVERYNVPTVMLCRSNGIVKGSVRSIEGINVYDALTDCKDLLRTFGGHDHAAGLSLTEENIPAFRERFEEAVAARFVPEQLVPAIEVDAVQPLEGIDQRFWAVLRQFEPHGPYNDTPIFEADALRLVGDVRTVGKDATHLKFAVKRADTAQPMAVIGFGLGSYLGALNGARAKGIPVDLLYSVQENTWNGTTTLQLRARDIRISEEAAL